MQLKTILPVLALASAAPILERDLDIVTVTDLIIETVTSYTTLWLPAESIRPVSTPVSASSSFSTSIASVPAPSAPAAVAVSPKPSPVVFTTQQAPPPVPTSSSVAAPVIQPTTTEAAVVPVASSTTDQGTSPAANGNVFAVATLPGATSPDGPCTESSNCSGDITHYNPSQGVGACGYKDWSSSSIWEDTDMVVAIPKEIFGTITNGGVAGDSGLNELCHRSVKIKRQDGGWATGKVVDKCMGCLNKFDLDLSPALFDVVAPNGNGRVHGVEWYWV